MFAAEVQRHAQQPGLEWDGFALEPVGVALAVPIFMVSSDEGLGFLEHRVWLEHLDGMVRMMLDDFHLVLVALLRVAQPAADDRAVHPGDRDVVQRRRLIKRLGGNFFQLQTFSHGLDECHGVDGVAFQVRVEHVKHLDHRLHDRSRVAIPCNDRCLRRLDDRRASAVFAPSGCDHFLQVSNCPLQVVLFQGEGSVFLRELEGVRSGLEGQDQIFSQPRLGDVPVNQPILDGGLDGIVVHTTGEQQARGGGDFLLGHLENF